MTAHTCSGIATCSTCKGRRYKAQLDSLRSQNVELRRELESYWRAYHAERCTHGAEWPHEGTCMYGPPAILDSLDSGARAVRKDREISKGIVTNRDRLGGTPTIKGTRISAEMVANLSEGDSAMSPQEISESYPYLSFGDIANARGWHRKGRPSGAERSEGSDG